MAGSIMVRYARKTYKQQKTEEDFKDLNHSVDIIPESMSIMTFETQKEAGKFASSIRDDGFHVIEIIDDYKTTKGE
jgi:uncharacterized FlgJ-related protein